MIPQLEGPPGPEIVVDGQPLLSFVGTSYLSLQGNPRLIDAALRATQTYGMNSASSRVVSYIQPPVIELEHNAARFFGHASATTFASAYAGPMILCQALADSVDAVFLDEFAHYAIEDGVRFIDAPSYRFAHRDAEDLAQKIAAHTTPGQRVLIATDGVFPALGKLAPVAGYLEVMQARPGSSLLLDDAHGLGVIGANGRGTYEACGIAAERINCAAPQADQPNLYVCGTLSKAFGAFGGLISGSAEFIQQVQACTHWHSGAATLPAGPAAAATEAFQILSEKPAVLAELAEKSALVRTEMRKLGFDVMDTPTPIVACQAGSAEAMQGLQQALRSRGILVSYVREYSGVTPPGIFRLTLQAGHTPEMIDRLIQELRAVWRK